MINVHLQKRKNGMDGEDICSQKSKKKKAAEDNNEEEIINMENENDEKTQSGNEVEDEESKLQNTLKIVEEIFGRVIRPLTKCQSKRNEMNNPPVLLISNGLGVSKCKGCSKSITKQELRYPNNMVFRRRGPTRFYNPKTNKYIKKEGNIHFHVNIKCLHGSTTDDSQQQHKRVPTTHGMQKSLSFSLCIWDTCVVNYVKSGTMEQTQTHHSSPHCS